MRAKELIIKEADLFEIDMSPSSLQRLASQIDARAGMEFEMIVPDTQGEDEGESEPDYDADERARSIEEICDFFHGDSSWNGRIEIERLRRRMNEDFEEWRMNELGESWDREGRDFLRDYIENNVYFDLDDARLTATDEIGDANPNLDSNSDEFNDLVVNRMRELEDEFVEEVWEEGIQGNSNIYDEAQDEFNNEKIDDLDEETWLRSEGIRYMSDIENSYEITWPVWTYGGSGEGRSIEEVASSFEYDIGKPVKWSSNYHGAKRVPGAYVVEPDGSLSGDDAGDVGLEFVSPPLPLPELISDLQKVKQWAENNGCYTNESTGLHMNISVPGWTGNLNELDYVKLALLLGDEYILDEFGRSGNTYAKSALEIVKRQAAQRPDDAKVLLDTMKKHLNTAAAKMIHTGVTSKYTSINVKDGYIEFRSPGGDWLGENFDKIVTTLLRFTVAMDAAVDPNKYRQEYLKKLYAILQPKSGQDTLAYFAQYAAGELPKQALKSFIRQAQLERKVSKDPTGGQEYWWNVSNPGNSYGTIEVLAKTKEEAIQKATSQDGYPSWANTLQNLVAKPIRPADSSPVRARVGEPEPVGRNLSQTDYENRLGWGSQAADANYEIVDRQTNRPVFLFIANTETEAWRKYSDWLAAAGIPDDTEDYGWRPRGARGQHAQSHLQFGQDQQQSGRYTYRVYTDSGQTAGTFQSDGIQGSTAANIAFRNYLSSIGRDSASGFNYEEIGREREATPARTSTVPGQAQQRFTGYWDVKMGDEVVFRVQAETQSEANQKAREWILGRSREFLHDHQGQEVEVVPRYE